ncbi:MAG: SPOR domain-containing protein [Treponema sp.]|jgi:hypothetical protein|nr:SPOR domain-containing protein [Treponema sp.]
MKKKYSAAAITAAFICSVSGLYGLDGYAVVSSDKDLVSGSIALDEKMVQSGYPLNSKLLIANAETGKRTEVTVIKSLPYDRIVEIPKEVADEIGIQGGFGRITLLTLAEAAGRFTGSGAQSITVAQELDTLPEKPSVAVAPGTQDRLSEEPAPGDTPGLVQSEPEEPAGTEPVEPNAPETAEARTPGNDRPETHISTPLPEIVQNPESREDLAIHETPDVKEAPILGPETSLPAMASETGKNDESPDIREEPSIVMLNLGPEINLPAEIPELAKAREVPIEESPKVANGSPPPSPERSYVYNENDRIVLTPSENRPPAVRTAQPGLPREAEIAPITRAAQTAPPPTASLPPEAEIPPITRAARVAPSLASLPPEAEIAPITRAAQSAAPPASLPREAEIPPATRAAQSAPPPASLPPETKAPPITRAAPVGPSLASLPREAEIAPAAAPGPTPPAGLPREAEIAPITRAAQTAPPPPASLPREAEIPPIAKTAPAGASGTKLPAEIQPASQAPGRASPAEDRSSLFSVPLISSLEKGKYYVQLAALSKSELVEPELSKIGRAYPLTVQAIGDMEKPLYRILLGPINLGESGALLQRFKGIGYKDAFVRQGT